MRSLDHGQGTNFGNRLLVDVDHRDAGFRRWVGIQPEKGIAQTFIEAVDQFRPLPLEKNSQATGQQYNGDSGQARGTLEDKRCAANEHVHELKSVPGSAQARIMAKELPMRFASRSNRQNPLPYRPSQHSLAKPIRKTAANAHGAGHRSRADKVSQKLHFICRRLSLFP